MEYTVRQAGMQDLPRIEEIYAGARKFMVENGNPNQWGTGNPPHDRIVMDIEKSLLYVIEENDVIHGVFYFFIGDDPAYKRIDDGVWHRNIPYGTIHRIAGDGSGGILKTAVAFAGKRINYLRIDPHEDNFVMQNAVRKAGFQRCGIIYVADGTSRVAYDLVVGK